MTSENIEFLSNGEQVPGYVARPDGDEQYPAVVVLQEWWGLNDHIREVVRRFAGEGFVALAPDLYRGRVVSEPDEARKLAMALERPQAVKDIQGAVNYLAAQPYVVPKAVGVVGFCMGGGLAAWMALEGQGIGAVGVFYGRADFNDDNTHRVSAPILGLFGEADGGIPVETVRANEAMLKKYNKPCEFVIYADAPHAFFNDERPAAYRPQAAADAWARTLTWLRTYLKPV
jgi:carboxymethylenebutenolidase